MEIVLGYITVPSLDEARRIGRILVAERLAACVNLLPGMESHYFWQGKMESAQETVLLAKTRADLREALTERVRELHSAEIPCILFQPVIGGLPEYLDWIREETEG